ncbi:hypothetical protein VTK56DRAFT_5161 [Thermocarpiscus australiensis]
MSKMLPGAPTKTLSGVGFLVRFRSRFASLLSQCRVKNDGRIVFLYRPRYKEDASCLPTSTKLSVPPPILSEQHYPNNGQRMNNTLLQ